MYALSDAEPKPMHAIGGTHIDVVVGRGRQPACPKLRMARVCAAFAFPEHAACRINGNGDFPAQPVHRQAADQCVCLRAFAIDEDIVAICPQDEIEQRLSLRAQQARP